MKTKTKKPARRTATRANKPKANSTGKATLVVFLLDRTGSMSSCKLEAISAFNNYVSKLQKENVDGMRMTVVQFDSLSIDTLHSAAPVRDVKLLTEETYVPRDMTPLYDVMGKTIVETEAKANGDKILFVTLTDGQNNSSHEWSLGSLKDLIRVRESDGWVFVYLGCGIQGWDALRQVSAGTQSVNNVLKTDKKNLVRSMARAGGQSVGYAAACSVGDAGIIGALKGDFFEGNTDDTDDKPSSQKP